MKQKIESYQGGPTAFHDLGLKDADELALKTNLVVRLKRHIEAEGLTITAAAKRLGIGQPDLSNLLRGRLDKYAVERLLRFLTKFHQDVEIRITPSRRKKREGEITVAV